MPGQAMEWTRKDKRWPGLWPSTSSVELCKYVLGHLQVWNKPCIRSHSRFSIVSAERFFSQVARQRTAAVGATASSASPLNGTNHTLSECSFIKSTEPPRVDGFGYLHRLNLGRSLTSRPSSFYHLKSWVLNELVPREPEEINENFIQILTQTWVIVTKSIGHTSAGNLTKYFILNKGIQGHNTGCPLIASRRLWPCLSSNMVY